LLVARVRILQGVCLEFDPDREPPDARETSPRNLIEKRAV